MQILEIRNRRGDLVMRAKGPLAIYASVIVHLISCASIVLVALCGASFLP